MNTVSPSAKYWLFKQERLWTGAEALASQGVCMDDVVELNRQTTTDQRCMQLAGESVSLFAQALYMTALLSTVDL